jgi:hypothetical protein
MEFVRSGAYRTVLHANTVRFRATRLSFFRVLNHPETSFRDASDIGRECLRFVGTLVFS